MKLAAAALGGVPLACAIAMMAAPPVTTGCTTHQCDPTFAEYFAQPSDAAADFDASGGFMLDENTFVTSALDGNWLLFQGNGTVRIWFPPEVAGRIAFPPLAYIGTVPRPNSPQALQSGATYTPNAGQLALFNDLNTDRDASLAFGDYGGSFLVKNGSCADYYAWFKVDFLPADAAPPTSDADMPFDGGVPDGAPSATDAAGDAPLDATGD